MSLRRALAALALLFVTVLCNAQLNTVRVMEIGRNALYFEDYVLSIRYFNQVIDSKPFLHEPYFYRALAKYYLEDYAGAVQDLDIAIRKNPYIPRSYQLRGLCHANSDSLVRAERDLRKALEFNPIDKEVWQNLAAVVMQQGDAARAVGTVDSLLQVSPRSSRAYLMRSQLAIDTGDTLMAKEMVGKAVECDRYSADVYEARAVVNMIAGDNESAEADLDKAIDLMPTRSSSYVNRALARFRKNDFRGAMEDYDKALYVDPASFEAHYNRGLLRMEVGDNNRAIEDFDWVLGVDPDNTMARFNRALLREKTGDLYGAADDFTAVIDAYPNFEYGYYCRASLRRKMGDLKGASADEEWLKGKRMQAAWGEPQEGGYAADKDATRKRSDRNVRNYNKMIASVVPDDGNYETQYRGKVQNRSVLVEFEPLYVLTYYKAMQELADGVYYYRPLEEFNQGFPASRELLLTNDERALASNEVTWHFNDIDSTSLAIVSAPDDYLPRLQRALDYYLVQDLEAAMRDLDIAVEQAPGQWVLYFVRSCVRYRMLETERANASGEDGVLLPKGENTLSNLDYRLVRSDLDKVIELVPDFRCAYFNRGNIAARMSDFKTAVVDYTLAIGVDDRFAEAYFNRGLARVYMGNYEDGIADLSKAGELGLYQAYGIIKRLKYSGRK